LLYQLSYVGLGIDFADFGAEETQRMRLSLSTKRPGCAASLSILMDDGEVGECGLANTPF
jgi:hypothetical protein